uniref:Leucine-rich repeat-containing N-terminal plant-type domain-containing protein n=1 Tax=Lactuca sativa TaxID=4236 RepID=A0A9R1WXF0_LACSA|nr:hypothetical protein LSAT_V11C900503150 [Lactuca sativa]
MCKTVDALNALKTQLQDPNNVLQSWNITQVNPCRWSHITCNNENRVARMELYDNNITGSIPYQIGNLTYLLSLDLYMNQLDGDIPDTLGNLKKLHCLYDFTSFVFFSR